jgi:type IX secretion system PorP/SprF family membrane protein
MSRIVSILYLIITLTSITRAQDIHFTQFYASPLIINPANTGVFNGNLRGIINYRNQWQTFAPFTTFAGSLDYNFGQRWLDNDLMGLGVSFFSDVAGDSEFSTTQVNVSYAYIKTLGSRFARSYASVGFYGGFAQRSINPANLTYGNQYNGYAYDPTIPGESIAISNFSFLDFGAGFSWMFVPKNRTNLYAGFAFHHVNQPSQSFNSSANDLLYMRSSVNAGAQIKISDNIDLVPGILTQIQGPHYEFVAGVNLKYYMLTKASNETAFSIGGWHRMGISNELHYQSDASAVAIRYDFMGLSAGLSYDINISGLNEASNSLGGPELSLIYTTALPHRDRKVDCPKF